MKGGQCMIDKDKDRIEYENLMAEMSRAKLTFKALSDIIGISMSTIYNKKSGVSDWTLAEMVDIQKVLQEKTKQELPLDYLFMKSK